MRLERCVMYHGQEFPDDIDPDSIFHVEQGKLGGGPDYLTLWLLVEEEESEIPT